MWVYKARIQYWSFYLFPSNGVLQAEGQDSCTAVVMLCNYLFQASFFVSFPPICLNCSLTTLVLYYKLLRIYTTFCIYIYILFPNSMKMSLGAAVKLVAISLLHFNKHNDLQKSTTCFILKNINLLISFIMEDCNWQFSNSKSQRLRSFHYSIKKYSLQILVHF